VTIHLHHTFYRPDEVDALCVDITTNHYGVMRGLFSAAQIAQCADELDDVYRRVANAAPGSQLAEHQGSRAFVSPQASIDGQAYVHMLNQLGDLAPITAAAFAHPLLADVVRAVLGSAAGLPSTALKYQNARPEEGSSYTRIGWHQDSGAVPEAFAHTLPTLTVTVHIDATGPANGFLRVVPRPRLAETSMDGRTFENVDGEVLLFAEPGDVLFHHSDLWHAAARGTASGEVGTRRHFRGAWTSRPGRTIDDISGTERLTFQMPAPAAR
jgi:ectoine hydroxylase-related dioxygenase (phytanoyl-CoA dioxygenase family)